MSKDKVPEVETAPEPEAPAQANGVFISRADIEGETQTSVSILGDVKATEVQTIIELGLKGWRERLGV